MINKSRVFGLLGLAAKAGKGAERRVFHGEVREIRESIPGHCLGRGVGKYKEEVPEYVYLL